MTTIKEYRRIFTPTSLGGQMLDAQQRFFADRALEIRKSHYGSDARQWTLDLLRLAEEAGLYDPELP